MDKEIDSLKKNSKSPAKATPASLGEAGQRPQLRPNLDRLTVGLDLGDQWSHYCILGLEREARWGRGRPI